jgi:hypothetical protein
MAKKDKKVMHQIKIANNRGEILLLYIKYTKRVLSNPPLKSEEFLVNQLNRIEQELVEWKKANKKVKLRNNL